MILTLGESKYCPVFEYIGPFFGQLAKFKITSVTGHVYCRDFPPRFADWYQCDPIELFDAPTLKREVV